MDSLGNGTTTDSSTPVQITALASTASAIAGGANHTVALQSNGQATRLTYNTGNELTRTAGATNKNFAYDANGNLTSSTNGPTLAYNIQNQVSSITPYGGTAVSMKYTGPGMSERVQAGSTTYQHDAGGMSQQTDTSGTTTLTTLPNGEVISESIPAGVSACPSGGSACTYYYLEDGAGSVSGVTNTAGTALLDSYTYDPTGNITSSTNGVSNSRTWGGGQYDSSTGLYRMPDGWYYNPAISHPMRRPYCHDQGWSDPGEDACGEDEPEHESYASPITWALSPDNTTYLGAEIIAIPTGQNTARILLEIYANGFDLVSVNYTLASNANGTGRVLASASYTLPRDTIGLAIIDLGTFATNCTTTTFTLTSLDAFGKVSFFPGGGSNEVSFFHLQGFNATIPSSECEL